MLTGVCAGPTNAVVNRTGGTRHLVCHARHDGHVVGQFGFIAWFTMQVESMFPGLGWMPGLIGLSLIYFYSHIFRSKHRARKRDVCPRFSRSVALGASPAAGGLLLAFFSNLFAKPHATARRRRRFCLAAVTSPLHMVESRRLGPRRQYFDLARDRRSVVEGPGLW